MRLSFCLIAAMATVSYAQSITTGAVEGVVTDEHTKEPLPGVFVTIGGQNGVTD